MKSWLRNGKGLTLVELMVVLVLLLLLATFMIPTFRRSHQRANVDLAVANLRAIRTAHRLYYLQEGVYTPNLNELAGFQNADCTGVLTREHMFLDPQIACAPATSAFQYSCAGNAADPFPCAATERTAGTQACSSIRLLNLQGDLDTSTCAAWVVIPPG